MGLALGGPAGVDGIGRVGQPGDGGNEGGQEPGLAAAQQGSPGPDGCAGEIGRRSPQEVFAPEVDDVLAGTQADDGGRGGTVECEVDQRGGDGSRHGLLQAQGQAAAVQPDEDQACRPGGDGGGGDVEGKLESGLGARVQARREAAEGADDQGALRPEAQQGGEGDGEAQRQGAGVLVARVPLQGDLLAIRDDRQGEEQGHLPAACEGIGRGRDGGPPGDEQGGEVDGGQIKLCADGQHPHEIVGPHTDCRQTGAEWLGRKRGGATTQPRGGRKRYMGIWYGSLDKEVGKCQDQCTSRSTNSFRPAPKANTPGSRFTEDRRSPYTRPFAAVLCSRSDKHQLAHLRPLH